MHLAQSTKKSKKRPEISRHKTGLWYKDYKGQFYYFYHWDGDDPEGLFSKDNGGSTRSILTEAKSPQSTIRWAELVRALQV